MIIEQLHLQSFKGFRDFNLDCSQFTVLVGPNNGGKTSILQAIQLLHDIFVFTFGAGERPNFANPRWNASPQSSISRLMSGDPEALWLHKRTSEPCQITARLSSDIELRLEISEPRRYDLDVLRGGNSIKAEQIPLGDQPLVENIFALRPTYLPPVGSVSATENFLAYPQLVEKLDRGQTLESWRNELYWRWNDGRKDHFDEMVEMVQKHLPRATIMPPHQTHDNPPRIVIEFEEEETTFDISMSGGGLLTLLSLAFVLRFSNAKCLLLDEPDAHLHASLQRDIARMLIDYAAENDVQVIAATHAPNFIAECPLDSLVWIDRGDEQGRPCTEIGRVLVDLGAITNADAIRVFGADKILFVEGSLDHQMLGRLLSLSDIRSPFDDQSVIVARLPSGKGDKTHLKAVQQLVRAALKLQFEIACIVDNDYDMGTEGPDESDDETGPLFLRLGRKEIENYLLDPAVIIRAANAAAERRKNRTSEEVRTPTEGEIRVKIESILADPNIRNYVKYQVVPRYRETLLHDLDHSTKEKQAEQWFDDMWNDDEWRINNCPGERVLAALRQWYQEEFDLTLTNTKLIEAMKKCPADVLEIAERLQSHFYPR